MKKIILLLSLFLLFINFALYSEQDRGIKVILKQLDNKAIIGKQYLVLIAVNKYQNWFPLKNPVNDAKDLKQILMDRYYFDEVIELYDEQATKVNIAKLFQKLQNDLKINDSLLIFYAGHGQLDKYSENGYWIPVDAGTDQLSKDKWLANSEIRGYLSKVEATHILLLSDSCFSGDLLNPTRGSIPQIDDDYFKKAYKGTSRQILTAGASETVPDKSEFIMQLKIELKKNNDLYLDPLMIFTNIRRGIRETTPMFGELKGLGHQEGASYLFFLKQKQEDTTAENKIKEEKKEDKVAKNDNVKNENIKKDEVKKEEIKIEDKKNDSKIKDANKSKEKVNEKKKEDISSKKDIAKIDNINQKKIDIKTVNPTFKPYIINNLNKTGISVMSASCVSLISGIIIFGVDNGYVLNLKNSAKTFADYNKYNNTDIAMFSTGITVMSLSCILIFSSIPMIVYQEKNKKISLNLEMNQGVSVFLNFQL